jgi:Fur family peroxide stress response transcriptional regulator
MAKTAAVEDAKPEVNLTRQREAILKVIRAREDHPTASEIFQAAQLSLPGISYATVYNSLRFLKEAGLVLEIKFGDSASRYDPICNCCGKLVDFDLPETVQLMRAAARKSKFHPSSVHLTLRGVCPDCNAKDAKGPARKVQSKVGAANRRNRKF